MWAGRFDCPNLAVSLLSQYANTQITAAGGGDPVAFQIDCTGVTAAHHLWTILATGGHLPPFFTSGDIAHAMAVVDLQPRVAPIVHKSLQRMRWGLYMILEQVVHDKTVRTGMFPTTDSQYHRARALALLSPAVQDRGLIASRRDRRLHRTAQPAPPSAPTPLMSQCANRRTELRRERRLKQRGGSYSPRTKRARNAVIGFAPRDTCDDDSTDSDAATDHRRRAQPVLKPQSAQNDSDEQRTFPSPFPELSEFVLADGEFTDSEEEVEMGRPIPLSTNSKSGGRASGGGGGDNPVAQAIVWPPASSAGGNRIDSDPFDGRRCPVLAADPAFVRAGHALNAAVKELRRKFRRAMLQYRFAKSAVDDTNNKIKLLGTCVTAITVLVVRFLMTF